MKPLALIVERRISGILSFGILSGFPSDGLESLHCTYR